VELDEVLFKELVYINRNRLLSIFKTKISSKWQILGYTDARATINSIRRIRCFKYTLFPPVLISDEMAIIIQNNYYGHTINRIRSKALFLLVILG
jgi:hypothetical protein